MLKKSITWILLGVVIAFIGLALPIGILEASSGDDPYCAKPSASKLPALEIQPMAQPVIDHGRHGVRDNSNNLQILTETDSAAMLNIAPREVQITTGLSCFVNEGFETILPSKWITHNLSNPLGTANWFQGNDGYFIAHSGLITSYIAVDLNSTSGVGTISNWLISPVMTLMDGDTVIFYTRTEAGSEYPDRLQVRLSTAGTSVDVGSDENSVGDFDTLLLDINPTLTMAGYPETWTEFSVVISGLPEPVTGRIAFRYFVTDAGGDGSNADYIGIDSLSVCHQPPPPICTFTEGFDTVVPVDWIDTNLSNPIGTTDWYQGVPETTFEAHLGISNSYAAANFNSTTLTGTISDWLISPMMRLNNNDTIIFHTRTVNGSDFPDRLQLRMSTADDSVNVGSDEYSVGDFTILLLDIDPMLEQQVYPEVWTEYRAVIHGLATPITGRIAFRYFVTDGGQNGTNSNYIGVDTFSVCHQGNYLPVMLR